MSEHNDDLGSSWLSSTNETRAHQQSGDQIGEFLRQSIPEPGASFWDRVDSSLDTIAAESQHSIRVIGRAGDAGESEPASPFRRGRILAAAAVFVMLVGLAGLLAQNRSGSDDALDVATAPNVDSASDTFPDALEDAGSAGAASAQSSLQPEGLEQAAPFASGPAPSGTPTFDPAADFAGPLDVLQVSVFGGLAEQAGPFCFEGDGVIVRPIDPTDSGQAFAWITIGDGGSISYIGGQVDPQISSSGFGVGFSDGQLEVQLPSQDEPTRSIVESQILTLTNTSLTVQGVELLRVPCGVLVPGDFEIIGEAEAAESAELDTLPQPVGALDADSVLTSAGLGPIEIGMNVSELSAMFGVDLQVDAAFKPLQVGDCASVVNTDDIFPGLQILVEWTGPNDGIIRRLTTRDSSFRTANNAGVGIPEEVILDLFGEQVDVVPLDFGVTGLFVVPTDPAALNTVAFFTSDNVVTSVSVGDRTWIGLIEGCLT